MAKEPLKILNTTMVDSSGNRIGAGAAATCDPAELVPADLWRALAPQLPAGAQRAPASADARRDRSAIVIDEWGPFDWLASVSAMAGRVGDTIAVTPRTAGGGSDWSLTLEYRGGETTSPRGDRRPAAVPYRFSFDRFEPRVEWDVRFYRWPDTTAKVLSTTAVASLATATPLVTRRESRIDYMWYRPAITGVPQARVATLATGTLELPAGRFTLRTISDDAIRVFIDGRLVIDHWTPHESAVDSAPIAPGRHVLRVEHAQVDGWTELRVDIVRGRQRSGGTPGPH